MHWSDNIQAKNWINSARSSSKFYSSTRNRDDEMTNRRYGFVRYSIHADQLMNSLPVTVSLRRKNLCFEFGWKMFRMHFGSQICPIRIFSASAPRVRKQLIAMARCLSNCQLPSHVCPSMWSRDNERGERRSRKSECCCVFSFRFSLRGLNFSQTTNTINFHPHLVDVALSCNPKRFRNLHHFRLLQVEEFFIYSTTSENVS